MVGGSCLLLACEGGTAPHLAPGPGGDGGQGAAFERAGQGGTGAAGNDPHQDVTGGGATASGSTPGVSSQPKASGVSLGRPDQRAEPAIEAPPDLRVGGSGGASSGGRGEGGGSDTGHGGFAGTGIGGSGAAGSDDNDDDSEGDGDRRFAVLPSEAGAHRAEDCLGASICHVTSGF
jgi:hypothetical protein